MKELHKFLVDNYSASSKKLPTLIQKSVDNETYLFITNTNQKKIVRISHTKKITAINNEVKLISQLQLCGIKTPAIVMSAKGKLCQLFNGNPVVCFDYIDHDNITDEYNKNAIYQAGRALGEFHSKSRNIGYQNGRHVYSEYERTLKNYQDIIRTYSNGKVFIDNVKKTLNKAKINKDKYGLIHNDYNVANVLFKKNKLQSIIDFDLSCEGPLIIDVAYGAVCWSTKNGEFNPQKDDFKQFVKAYNDSSPFKVKIDEKLFFWAAFSCLSIACDLLCDSLKDNNFNIKDIYDSWMYRRFEYYINKRQL